MTVRYSIAGSLKRPDLLLSSLADGPVTMTHLMRAVMKPHYSLRHNKAKNYICLKQLVERGLVKQVPGRVVLTSAGWDRLEGLRAAETAASKPGSWGARGERDVVQAAG